MHSERLDGKKRGKRVRCAVVNLHGFHITKPALLELNIYAGFLLVIEVKNNPVPSRVYSKILLNYGE